MVEGSFQDPNYRGSSRGFRAKGGVFLSGFL